ncbi:uncharacterized protein SPSK_07942 [Sporothrix schenckii 1099-18]|uniref:Uncharacterized protein n=1 Tax=Sporothrix schenckii 1099-18 TaxID=1397361 RepID=A0A0F2MGV7_SPOSC|nr:uncharacterized protein SPSK_07942 [Sporothrix schenckii 1099-18]KJR88070.1 hypothetical protein SPSK_07942 [Sporothrix schenckii 1099-18]
MSSKCRRVVRYSVTNNVCCPPAVYSYYTCPSYYLYYPPPVVVAYPTVCWTPTAACVARFHAAGACPALVVSGIDWPHGHHCHGCQHYLQDQNTSSSTSPTPAELTSPRIEDVTMSGANGDVRDGSEGTGEPAGTVASGTQTPQSPADEGEGGGSGKVAENVLSTSQASGSKIRSKSRSKTASKSGSKSGSRAGSE